MNLNRLLLYVIGLLAIVSLCSCDPGTDGVTLTPSNAKIEAGHYIQYTAAGSYDNDGYAWYAFGSKNAALNIIDGNGLLKAPTTLGKITVGTQSNYDNLAKATTSLTVIAASTQPVAVSITSPTSTDDHVQNAHFKCTSVVTGSVNQQVIWSVVGTNTGSFSGNGDYNAPSAVGIYTIKATSVADPTKSATSNLYVGTGSPTVTIQNVPTSPVTEGAKVQLAATVVDGANQSVTWSTSAGAITQAGLLTAPPAVETVIVTATSTAYKVSATAKIVVTPAISGITVKIVGTPTNILTGSQFKFSAVVTGTTDQAVVWSVAGNGGTIDSSGIYTTPAISGSCTVEAESVADGKTKATETFYVNGNYFNLSLKGPSTVSLGSAVQYTASVFPAQNVTYLWSIAGTTGGMTISKTGLLTVPTNTPSGIYDIRVAVSAASSDYIDYFVHVVSL